MSKKIISLINVTASYPSVLKKNLNNPSVADGSKPKYECSFIIDKSDFQQQERILTAFSELYAEAGLRLSKDHFTPLFNGDEYDNDGYHGKVVLKSSSLYPVKVFDQMGNMITDIESELFYGGCIVNALIEFKFKKSVTEKQTGIMSFLQAISFVSDGERLGGESKEVEEQRLLAFIKNPASLNTPTSNATISPDLRNMIPLTAQAQPLQHEAIAPKVQLMQQPVDFAQSVQQPMQQAMQQPVQQPAQPAQPTQPADANWFNPAQ